MNNYLNRRTLKISHYILSYILIFYCSVNILYGQGGVISGIVKDSIDGYIMTGAHVVLNDTGKVAITDYSGNFQFKNLDPGKYSLSVSFIGYITHKRNLTLDEGQNINLEFFLTPKPYEAEAAVITGTRIEVARENVPLTVSTITRSEIEESFESNVLPVVSQRTPGVFVTERGVSGFSVAEGSAGQISIRGIGGSPNTQVLVLIDGHPQYMGLFGHPLPDSYVSSDVEKVEIVRGPASILYGSNAMGGVINIITRKQNREGASGNARIQYGSFNTQKYMGSAGYKKKKFSIYASVNHDRTDGHRENSSFKITNGYIKSGYKVNDNLKLTVDANLSYFESEDPGPARNIDSSYLTQDHWVDIMRGKVSLSLDNSYNKTEGSAKLFYNFGEHEIYDGFHSRDNNYGLMAYQALKLFRGNSITIGIDYKNYGGIAENTVAMGGAGIQFIDTSIYELGSYLYFQQKLFERMNLTAGLRFENHEIFGTEWVPQFGLTYNFKSQTTIKGTVSKGFRSPTIRELFLWQTANPGLKPETLWNYEAGLIQYLLKQKIRFEMNLFYAEGSNLIQVTGRFPDVLNENTGNFTHYGAEFMFNYHISKEFHINTNYAYLNMDQPVTAAPVHQFFLGGTHEWKKFIFHANIEYIGRLYTLTSPTEETQTYTLLNAKLSYRIGRCLEAYIGGDNLMDVKYEINYDYPMPGITVYAGLQWKYNPRKKSENE